MTEPTPEMLARARVTTDDAVRWMEEAMRNFFPDTGLSHDDIEDVRYALTRFRVTALIEAEKDKQAALERAWRDGFQSARDCLSDDDAFCLTDDVERDAWADSETHTSIRSGEEG